MSASSNTDTAVSKHGTSTSFESLSSQGNMSDRLLRAADALLRRDGVDAASIESVAAAAGVSRATAFRQLGKRDQMIESVALMRSGYFVRECRALMNRHKGAFAQFEAAFVYLVRELPNDPVIRELLYLRTAGELGPAAHDQAVMTLGPVVEHGQNTGEIRSDVSVDRIVHWLIEQIYLSIQQADRSEKAVRDRVRTFLMPALSRTDDSAVAANLRSRTDTLGAALRHAQHELAVLESQLPR